MNNVVFDKEGTEAERLCASQFNGTLVNDLTMQFKDIDVLIPSKTKELKTCSVKDQLRGTKKGYDSVQVELLLVDSDSGDSMQGCFYSNDSDYYFWRVWWKGKERWCIIPSASLKEYIEENKESLNTWGTTNATAQRNKSMGRKYNKSSGVELPLSVMNEIGTWRTVIH